MSQTRFSSLVSSAALPFPNDLQAPLVGRNLIGIRAQRHTTVGLKQQRDSHRLYSRGLAFLTGYVFETNNLELPTFSR